MTDSKKLPRLFFENTSFSLSKDLLQFLHSIQTEARGAIRFPTLEYRPIRKKLQNSLMEAFGRDSRQYMDLSAAVFHCAGCLWEFPPAYCNTLFFGPLVEDVPGAEKSETPGAQEFAQTGICPLCGYQEAVLIYETYQLEQIGSADLQAIQDYWQQQAREWWRIAGNVELHCSLCNAQIMRDTGYLLDKYFLCAACTEHELSDGVKKLQRYPHELGKNILRKARTRQET